MSDVMPERFTEQWWEQYWKRMKDTDREAGKWLEVNRHWLVTDLLRQQIEQVGQTIVRFVVPPKTGGESFWLDELRRLQGTFCDVLVEIDLQIKDLFDDLGRTSTFTFVLDLSSLETRDCERVLASFREFLVKQFATAVKPTDQRS